MQNITRLFLILCGLAITCSSARSLPLFRAGGNFATNSLIEQENDISSIKKRSTNADIRLNGSRSARMQDLLRRYMLLTILENVKGKRSGTSDILPLKSDGTPDYKQIAGVVMARQGKATTNPWYVVDMKRDAPSEEEADQDYDFYPSMVEDLQRQLDTAISRSRNEHKPDPMPFDTSVAVFPRLAKIYNELLNYKLSRNSKKSMEESFLEESSDDKNGKVDLLEALGM